MNQEKIVRIIEASLLAAGSSLSKDKMLQLFAEDEGVKMEQITAAVETLREEAEGRGIELVEVASGFRYQARQEYAEWIARLWEERPARYSRALLETLALIAYRQPTTRSDIEQVRGVSVSSSIIKTLLEREWVRVVGHRDVPGKPALYATTKAFLDYFNLKSLDELPSLSELKDLDNLNPELQFEADEEQSEQANQSAQDTRVDPDSAEAGYDGVEQPAEEQVEGIESVANEEQQFDDAGSDSLSGQPQRDSIEAVDESSRSQLDHEVASLEDESLDTESEESSEYQIH